MNIYDIAVPTTIEGYVVGPTGEVFISTDEVYNKAPNLVAFNPRNYTGILATAEFRSVSVYKNDQAIAVFRGTADGSALLHFTGPIADITITPTLVEYTTLEVFGIELGPDDAADATINDYLWGRLSNGNSVIIKHNSGGDSYFTSSERPTTRIRKVFFVDNVRGYAVGDSGAFYKLTNSAAGINIENVSIAIGTKLNSCFFFKDPATAYYFGWLVGEAGQSYFVVDNGTSVAISSYSSGGTFPDINDVYAIKEGNELLVHAYIAANGGKIYKLASPVFTQITPETRSQGWIGTVEVDGSGFLDVAQFVFRMPGTTETDPGITVIPSTDSTDTKLKATVMISTEANAGTREVAVINGDGTIATMDFHVVAQTGSLEIGPAIYFQAGTDWRRLYTSPECTVDSGINASFEARSSNPVLNKDNLIAKVIASYNDLLGNPKYLFSDLPPSGFTQDSANKVHIVGPIPSGLPTGKEIDLTFYVEDSSTGDVSQETVKVVAEFASPEVNTGDKPDTTVRFTRNRWNPDTGTIGVWIDFTRPGYRPPATLTARLTDSSGRLLLEKLIDSSKALSRIAITLSGSEMAPYFSTGLAVLTVSSGHEILGKGFIAITAK